jgi:hypothetical protein
VSRFTKHSLSNSAYSSRSAANSSAWRRDSTNLQAGGERGGGDGGNRGGGAGGGGRWVESWEGTQHRAGAVEGKDCRLGYPSLQRHERPKGRAAAGGSQHRTQTAASHASPHTPPRACAAHSRLHPAPTHPPEPPPAQAPPTIGCSCASGRL